MAGRKEEVGREPLAMSVEAAASSLGIGRSLAWELVRRGELVAIRAGRRTLVPRLSIERFIGQQLPDGWTA